MSAATIDSLLVASTQRYPDRPALSWGEHELSYRQVTAAVDRLAARLATTARLAAGQRLGIVAPNLPALAIGMFAAWRVGAVAVPLSARYREYELRRILGDAAVAAVVTVPSYRGYSFVDLMPSLLADLPALRCCLVVDPLGEVEHELLATTSGQLAEPEPLDPGFGVILYTSGTTGEPKGALVSHAREVNGASACNEVLGASESDCAIFVVPISHAFGLTCFNAAIAAGSQVVLVESTFSADPMVEAIERSDATLLHGSPTLFTSFLKSAPASLPTLRAGLVAGATCRPQLLQQLDEVGLRILNLYGMTEIGAATCCRPDDPAHVRYTTVGRPFPGYELRIVGAAGQLGEVQVRGPYVTRGYFRQPERTAAAFDGEWLRTGDLGSLDRAGNLTIEGRAKDVVQVAGHNVFPAEVEGFLLTHPAVAQAVVVGVPHETMGEVLHAFVVLQPEARLAPAELLRFARPRIAGYKLPYAIEVVAELPTLASGKPDRRALAHSARHGATEATHAR